MDSFKNFINRTRDFQPELRRSKQGLWAMFTLITILSLVMTVGSGCQSGGGNADSNDPDAFDDEQPRYPEEGDDPWFLEPITHEETFRILITQDNYSVRQVANQALVRREEDPLGDEDQVKFFKTEQDLIDFKDWVLEGTMSIRMSPLTRNIEHIAYVSGETPQTWQASKFFQDDVSRFQFQFPAGVMALREFNVRYRWVIEARPGLSEEEQRQRAIQWLQSQAR